jgi:Flp pilus assembly protein TadG
MARRSSGTRGSEAIEFAIVLPALLMFVLGLMDMGRLLWTNVTLSHAVEAAARCASVKNTSVCGSTPTQIASYAASQAWGLGLTSAAFTATTPVCGNNVSGTLNFAFIIPWYYVASPFGAGNAMTLTAVACYPS